MMKKLLIFFTLFTAPLCAMEQPTTTRSIHEAAEEGNLAEVQRWLEQGTDVNQQDRDTDGATPLHFAAHEGHQNIVAYLIASRANVNQQTIGNGETPLHFAAHEGHQNVAECLIVNGANVNQQDHYGLIPLHKAALSGHQNVIQYLIAHGAHVNQQNRDGSTSLLYAARLGDENVIKCLIAHGANPLITRVVQSPAHGTNPVPNPVIMVNIIEDCPRNEIKNLIVQKREQYLRSLLSNSWRCYRVLLIPRIKGEESSPWHVLPLEIVDIIKELAFAEELREIREWKKYKEDHPEIVGFLTQ